MIEPIWQAMLMEHITPSPTRGEKHSNQLSPGEPWGTRAKCLIQLSHSRAVSHHPGNPAGLFLRPTATGSPLIQTSPHLAEIPME